MIYEHKVQYYETDQMKIVHHSNYIRWFEEARTAWMEEGGFGYAKMEEAGIISPVLEVDAKYKSMTHYGDIVLVEAAVEKYNGVRLEVSYKISDKKTGEIRCTGFSKHCFLDGSGHPVKLGKLAPKADEMFQEFFRNTHSR